MRDTVLWRKQSRIIMLLADALHIDAEKALDLFYSTKIYQQLSDPKYGLQLMSDGYILEDLLDELKKSPRMNANSATMMIMKSSTDLLRIFSRVAIDILFF